MDQETRKPLYHAVQDYIKDLISSQKIKSDEKIPSEKELIDKFKVSRITISYAMSNLTKEGLIYRVPGRGSFVAPGNPRVPIAKEPKREGKHKVTIASSSAQSDFIGLILPNIDSLFAMRIVESIHRVMDSNGYSLSIMLTNNSKKKEQQAIRSMIEQGAKGLVIFPVDEDTYNDEILALKLQGYPFVLIDRYLPGVDTHLVSSDNQFGARLAVAHLWELGHRNIAVCSSINLPTITINDRVEGYRKELTARGALINPALMLADIEIKESEIDETHPLYRYMKAKQATAFLALHSSIAVLIHKTATKIGLKVPEDISIVAFDNPTTFYDEFSFFTYVAQSEELMGKRAAEIVLKLLNPSEQESVTRYHRIILEPKLMLHRSTTSIT